MHKLKHVDLGGTGIRNLPQSMQNLEGIQVLSLGKGEMLEINESSNFFQNLSMFFPNLTKLVLQNLDITILPASIEKCHSLKFLHVGNCKNLQEIRGLPLSIKGFSAANSPVEANSLTLKLRQAIDSATMKVCVLQSRKIPELFDHSSRGNSLNFWFRKELPTLAVCAIIGVWDNVKPPFAADFRFFVGVKENIYKCVCCFRCSNIGWITEDSYIIILNLQNDFQHPLNSDIQKVLLTNEWIPGKILWRINPESDSSKLAEIRRTGVYVNRTFSRMEDVRFEDPYDLNKASTMDNKLMLVGEASHTQQQEQSSALFNPTTKLESVIGEQPLNYVYNSDSKESASTVYSNKQDGVVVGDQPILAPSSAETQNAEAKREIASLISEVSSEFTAQVSMKIESTASQSPKVDEVEAGLKTQNQFRNTMVLENQIHQRLTRIKKMKEELGEKLSAIKADISAIEANNSSIKANISDIKVIFLQIDQSSILFKVNRSHNGLITLLGETPCFRFCNKLPSFTVCAVFRMYASEGVSDTGSYQHLHDKKRAKRSQEPLAGKVTVKGMQCNAGKSSLAASLSLPLHVSCS
ncbi:hypothetical protein V8G54_011315 [Vigna mungo]|uniref:Uncharacterized protein n=1 Tax=Vigna mungo TaxID=3915 RepID=A0AAQ3RZH7_VIGMU